MEARIPMGGERKLKTIHESSRSSINKVDSRTSRGANPVKNDFKSQFKEKSTLKVPSASSFSEHSSISNVNFLNLNKNKSSVPAKNPLNNLLGMAIVNSFIKRDSNVSQQNHPLTK